MTHSLTGASSAERWMNCNGYLYLARGTVVDPDRQDPEYTRQGTAGHAVAAQCLRKGMDAWEFTGQTFEGVTIGEGAHEVSPAAIQVYLDECRQFITRQDQYWTETAVGADEAKRPHPGFFGTLDFAAFDYDAETLHIRDLKLGEGVYVDVKDNEQLKYYAYGLLLWLDEQNIDIPLHWTVELGIVQPRHWETAESPVSIWMTTVHNILSWGANTLIPAMERQSKAADENPEFSPGDWCRFCPVKLRCPALRGVFAAAVKGGEVGRFQEVTKVLTDKELGLEYCSIYLAEMYIKDIKAETLRRLEHGKDLVGTKLVRKKADRAWKNGALPIFVDRLGDLAMTVPELKSPAQMEKLSDQAKKLVAEWAFVPNTGLTVALETDKRPRETAATPAETFSEFIQTHGGDKVSKG